MNSLNGDVIVLAGATGRMLPSLPGRIRAAKRCLRGWIRTNGPASESSKAISPGAPPKRLRADDADRNCGLRAL
jgi:hypothetical protein